MGVFFQKLLQPVTLNLVDAISMKLGMKHWVIKSIIVYSNDGTQLTLTYITARSKL